MSQVQTVTPAPVPSQFEAWVQGAVNAGLSKFLPKDAVGAAKFTTLADAAVDVALYEAQTYGVALLISKLTVSHPQIASLIQQAVNAGELLLPGLVAQK